MGEWVQIPAHRVHVILFNELLSGDYEPLGDNGEVLNTSQLECRSPVMYRRVRDGVLFRPARSYGAVGITLGTWSKASIVLESV